VHVYADTITHSVVPVAGAEAGDYFDEAWLARMAALDPAQRLEQFSRKR
jgi:3',5'-cyclic-AMP phosphodiesterase